MRIRRTPSHPILPAAAAQMDTLCARARTFAWPAAPLFVPAQDRRLGLQVSGFLSYLFVPAHLSCACAVREAQEGTGVRLAVANYGGAV